MSGVVTLGETMGLLVARTAGALPHVDGFRLAFGGAESNVAIGVARLGERSVWMGRVGDDGVGELIARELRAEGVETRIIVDASAPTGLMIKSTPLTGRTRVDYHRRGSAGSRFAADDVDAELIAGADVLHLTGITLALSASAREAVFRAAEIARSAGVAVSVDVNHRERLWPASEARAHYRRLAGLASILVAGDDEARMLVAAGADASPLDLARAMVALGPNEAIVTSGPEGALALVDGEAASVEAVRITPTDTVGAGDAFVAGYLSERLRGEEPSARLRTAVLAGAAACLGAGDWESLPRRADLASLASREPVAR